MSHMSTMDRQISSHRRVGIGEVALVSERFEGPIDMLGATDGPYLQLSLTGRHAVGCFPDHWGPSRFERMGSLFLLPARHQIHTRSDSAQQRSIVCQFDLEATRAWFEEDLEWTNQRLAGSLNISSTEIRALLIRIGRELRNPGFGSDTFIELMLAQIGIELTRHFRGIESEPNAGGLAPWRLRIIDDYLSNDAGSATLSELAATCGLSVRHLTRAYRVSRGESIGKYVSERRMDRAKRMLATGYSVKETAHTVGFTAATNFGAAFRRAMGETPHQYRRRVATLRHGLTKV